VAETGSWFTLIPWYQKYLSYFGSVGFCDDVFDSGVVFELVNVVPVLQEEDDEPAHVRAVDQEIRGEGVAADDVILSAWRQCETTFFFFNDFSRSNEPGLLSLATLSNLI